MRKSDLEEAFEGLMRKILDKTMKICYDMLEVNANGLSEQTYFYWI